jgi:hypothetical protein
MWSTRRLNDMDPCPWPATFRRRRDGVPVQLVTHYFFRSSPGAIPESRPAGGTWFGLELGNNLTWT